MLASWLARAVKLQLLLSQLGSRPAFVQTLCISPATDFRVRHHAGRRRRLGGQCLLSARNRYLGQRRRDDHGGGSRIGSGFFALAVPVAGLALVWSGQSHTLTSFAFGATALAVLLTFGALLARRKVATWLFGTNALCARWPRLREKQRVLREFCAKVGTQGSLLLAAGPTFPVLDRCLDRAAMVGALRHPLAGPATAWAQRSVRACVPAAGIGAARGTLDGGAGRRRRCGDRIERDACDVGTAGQPRDRIAALAHGNPLHLSHCRYGCDCAARAQEKPVNSGTER